MDFTRLGGEYYHELSFLPYFLSFVMAVRGTRAFSGNTNTLLFPVLYGKLVQGKRKVGGQKMRYKDRLKVSLKSLGIDILSWEHLAQNRPMWHSLTSKGAKSAEGFAY